MNNFSTEEQQHGHNKQGCGRSQQGAAERLIDAEIQQLFRLTLAELSKVFSNTVEHNNGIVQRIPDYRQQSCDDR